MNLMHSDPDVHTCMARLGVHEPRTRFGYDIAQWRLVAPSYGEARALPSTRGITRATDGCHLLIEQPFNRYCIVHITNWVADPRERSESVTRHEVKTPKATKVNELLSLLLT